MNAKLKHLANLACAIAVLGTGSAAVSVCLQGWQALSPTETPKPLPSATETDVFLEAATTPGGYWHFAGFPWTLEATGEPTTAAPEARTLIERFEYAGPDAGVLLQPDQFDALRHLSWLGASETPFGGSGVLWEMARGRIRIALAFRRAEGQPTRLLGGLVIHEDPNAKRWTTYALTPLSAAAESSETFVPDTAHPTRIASRFNGRGERIIEVAQVSDRRFLAGDETQTEVASDEESRSGGLRKFAERTITGRKVSYYRTLSADDGPVLVVAATGD